MDIRLDCIYNLVAENHPIGFDQEAGDGTYNPYNLFVLETRLFPYIYKLFLQHGIIQNKSDILPTFHSVYDEKVNKKVYHLKISFTQENEENRQKLESKKEELENGIRKKISEITSVNVEYALIDKEALYDAIYYEPNAVTQNNVNEGQIQSVHHKNNLNLDKKMPYDWFCKVLEYTGLDSRYNPFIGEDGIYLSFNPYFGRSSETTFYPSIPSSLNAGEENPDLSQPQPTYQKAYYQVCQFLINKIKDYYKRGVIVLNDIIDAESKVNFVKNWHLTPIDEEEIEARIFETKWIDNRFAPDKVEFLLNKLQGNNYMYFWTPDNLVVRHQIARSLQSASKGMIVEGSYIKVEADNFKEAQLIASLYEAALLKVPIGRVLPIAASRLSEVLLYFQYAQENFSRFTQIGEDGVKEPINCVSYGVDNVVNPYMFSFFLPNEVQSDADALRREFKSFSIKRLVEVSKVTKLKSISPHSIIEEEF